VKESGAVAGAKTSGKIKFQDLVIYLSGLLVLQLGLSGLLFFFQTRYAGIESSVNLVDADINRVNKLTIEIGKSEGKGPTTLTLQKSTTGWVLPQEHDFPADSGFVTKFFSALSQWKKGIPVTTTQGAPERFKVGADNFELAVTIFDDHPQPRKFFIGSAPSFKSRYVRLSDSNDIYSVDIPDFLSLPAKLDDVIDIASMKPNAYSITSLSSKDFEIKQSDPPIDWKLVSGGKQEIVHGASVRRVLSKSLDFPIQSLLGSKPSPDYNLDNPDFVIKLGMNQGAAVTYSFSKPKGSDKYYHVLKVSNNDYFLEVADSYVDAMKKIAEEIQAEDARRKEAAKKSAEKSKPAK
jgi:hypothetical protein